MVLGTEKILKLTQISVAKFYKSVLTSKSAYNASGNDKLLEFSSQKLLIEMSNQ